MGITASTARDWPAPAAQRPAHTGSCLHCLTIPSPALDPGACAAGLLSREDGLTSWSHQTASVRQKLVSQTCQRRSVAGPAPAPGPLPGVGKIKQGGDRAPHTEDSPERGLQAAWAGLSLGWKTPCPHSVLLPGQGFQEQLVLQIQRSWEPSRDRCDRFSLSPRQ